MDEKEKDATPESPPEVTQPMEQPPAGGQPPSTGPLPPPPPRTTHDWKTGALIALACLAVLLLVAVLVLSIAFVGGHHGCREFRGERGEKNEGRGYGMPMFRDGPMMRGSWPAAPQSSTP